MDIKKGIGVSPGIVIGAAIVLDAEDLLIPERRVGPKQVESEVERLQQGIGKAQGDLADVRNAIRLKHGKEISGIFDFHIGVLKDKSLITQIVNEIREHSSTAEYAVSTVMRKYANQLLAVQDAYLAERVKDIYDLERRMLRTLIGQKQQDLNHLTDDVIVIAHDLMPSQTAALDRERVKAFVTDVGGRTSHTAIVARAMGIPAIVGLGNITADVSGGDTVIVDGRSGVVIINPDPEQIAEFEAKSRRETEIETEYAQLADMPAQTLDGKMISLQANIEFPDEVDDALRFGASGIGLYRTEFLYLASETEPTEEDQFRAYAESLRRLKGRPLTLRTLDLGADKYTQARAANPERNPFLGDRSIRMCLHDIPMFKRQLRAIMRASVLGDVRIMFPMISTMMELRQAKMVLRDVMEELEDEGQEFREGIPVGMMMEVPSAALMADSFAKEVNFFSIGTNDLIQYTLAVDRTNEKVASLFCPAHPAVLKLVRDVIRTGARNSLAVSVCGEMAGEPLYTLLLLGLGLNQFSMNAPDLPEVKKIIRSTTMKHAHEVARRVMSFESERQVMHYLREETRKIIPEAI